ncbi:MAG: N-formylglutamate deformylase [Azospirillaceae bacterium]
MTGDADLYDLERGTTPLLIDVPHAGTSVPAGIAERMTEAGRAVPDTDWFVDRLYAFARELGAGMMVARHSRFVVDLNRPPDDASLYPGQATTGLVPTTLFDGAPIYRDGQAPDEAEIAARRETYWVPYHAALAAEIDRLVAEHGRAVLWDAHSIRSVVPRLFDGRLPDLNLGTARGASCRAGLREGLSAILEGQESFSAVVDGRFVGGYVTRHYGRPEAGVDAVQMEIAQTAYMDEAAATYDTDRAGRLRPVLDTLLRAALGPAA